MGVSGTVKSIPQNKSPGISRNGVLAFLKIFCNFQGWNGTVLCWNNQRAIHLLKRDKCHVNIIILINIETIVSIDVFIFTFFRMMAAYVYANEQLTYLTGLVV